MLKSIHRVDRFKSPPYRDFLFGIIKKIAYNGKYKSILMSEQTKMKSTRKIIEECDFDPDILGIHRIIF